METKAVNVIRYDGAFDIATGKSRKEVHWKNRETTWAKFLLKISKTHRTAEKYAEYMVEKKARQDEIKDVGGFVGGYVNAGRRKADNILHRQLITLDIDFAKDDIWETFTMLYDNAAAMYSTHKHTAESPRLRLIIPLDRPVACDEYMAICRRVAGALDINAFDDTTYEPSRLMYWPSTAADGDFVFEYQDGEWLCADKVLKAYKNWKDASEWPVSDRVDKVIQREIKKQGDPTEKPGIVGAFCRTYGVEEAITAFLGDVYEACDTEGRYTFRNGSTAGGMVVYEDKFTYSHHGTDPTSGRLCNAFDLVRLHLYGLKDEDAKENTPSNKLPSYLAMQDFAAKDKAVRRRLGAEKLQDAKEDFADDFDFDTGEDANEWLGEMETDRKGNYPATIKNFRTVLNEHQGFKGKLKYNEFRNTLDVTGELPWAKSKAELGIWSNLDNTQLSEWMERNFDMSCEGKLKIAKTNVFGDNRYHPVREYLKGLKWDGSARVERLFIDYLGAEDSEYVRAATRKSLVACVARIFEPGAKFDYVVVLVGEQGIGKSVLLQKLGKFERGWFSDNFNITGTNKDVEQVIGVWIKEIQELAGIKGKDAEKIKSFISSRQDETRLAYKEEKNYFPRQCVFFGTTNDRNFLNDPTGNRRFWPIAAGVNEAIKKFNEVDKEVDQIWAEAVTLYKAGEKLYLSPEMEAEARLTQEVFNEIDSWEDDIDAFLDKLLPEGWETATDTAFTDFEGEKEGTVKRDSVTMKEIWRLCFGEIKPIDRISMYRIFNIMRRKKEWVYKIHKRNKKSIRGWKKS
jgi:predicted P-loop ATPase